MWIWYIKLLSTTARYGRAIVKMAFPQPYPRQANQASSKFKRQNKLGYGSNWCPLGNTNIVWKLMWIRPSGPISSHKSHGLLWVELETQISEHVIVLYPRTFYWVIYSWLTCIIQNMRAQPAEPFVTYYGTPPSRHFRGGPFVSTWRMPLKQTTSFTAYKRK